MRRDDFPAPVSDPASAGLPDYADDDSTADERVPSVREADGPDPAPLPPDRDDGPLALDDYGTTAEEQRRGEPLEGRLAREEPDDASAPPDREDGDGVPHEWDIPDPEAIDDDEPIEARPDSPVSVYERIPPDPITGGRVGRLVQPDQGAHEDVEADEVAADAGPAGGGPGAEEAGLHEIGEDV